MTRSYVPAILFIGTLAACTAAVPPHKAIMTASIPPVSLPQGLTPQATLVEASRLRSDLMQEVPGALEWNQADTQRWIMLTKQMLARQNIVIDRAQLLVVVDRNPARQELALIVAQSDAPWLVIGGGYVSTGKAGRRGYFITPTGVFVHDASILDYRAQGTYNENHIRGLGVMGMRVWDFGWQTARKGWRDDGEEADIRLQVHATDPTYLEQFIGHPASKGCIRVSADMNLFMDKHGVLDFAYEQAAITDAAFKAILSADLMPTKLSGDMLVVIDSSMAPLL